MKVLYLSIGTSADRSLLKSYSHVMGSCENLELMIFDEKALNHDIDKNLDFLNDVAGCDFAIVNSHADVYNYRYFDKFIDAVKNNDVPTFLASTQSYIAEKYSELMKIPAKDRSYLTALIKLGGPENWASVLLWSMNHFSGTDFALPEPHVYPAQGILDPECGYRPLDEMKNVLSADMPNAVLLFHQKQFINNNVEWVKDAVSVFSSCGINLIPVFMITYKDDVLGSIGITGICSHLSPDGKPLVDAIVNSMSFSQKLLSSRSDNDGLFFERLDIPVLKVLLSDETLEEWKANPLGASKAQMPPNLNSPEFDGQIDSRLIAVTETGPDGSKDYRIIEERVRKVAATVKSYCGLRSKDNSEKRVAIILYMYPPRMDLAGGAYGLDSFASVSVLLKRLHDAGYSTDDYLPTGEELCNDLLSRITNCLDNVGNEDIRSLAPAIIPSRRYKDYLETIPEDSRTMICKNWGSPPGKVMTSKDGIVIPGIIKGNIYIGFQPDRGKSTAESYHDAYTSMPHQYLAYYDWLNEGFKADAMVHVGTHGTLEWLPGKSAFLGEGCYPDLALGHIPNIYPYIVDNPGEGIQSKRRSAAVITTHNIPPMMRTRLYGHLRRLEDLVSTFRNARINGAKQEEESAYEEMLGILNVNNLDALIREDPDITVDAVHDHILDLKDNLIYDGLHILGKIPEGKRLEETIYSLTKIAPPGCSLVEALKDTAETDQDVEGHCEEIIHIMAECDFDLGECLKNIPGASSNMMIAKSVEYIAEKVYPKLVQTSAEMDNIMRALDGKFIEPSPSGCPTRGSLDMLPTGRNFYSLDPYVIPWPQSWEIGWRQAEQMVSRHLEEKGCYPENVGFILWDVETIRTGGEDIAYILRLMGLEPEWSETGKVIGLNVTSIEDLGRPRIDVTIRSSGLFRDTFPNLLELLDEGVRTIADLDEADEENLLKANVRREVMELMSKGIPEDEARRRSAHRLFSAAPGQYGAGVIAAIVKSGWDKLEDLSQLFVDYGCYAYGKDCFGERSFDDFKRRLSKLDVTVKNHTTREMDMFDMDDEYDFLGGMNAAVTALSGKKPVSYMGDSSDPKNIRTRTAEEEAAYIFRSKINNPEWIAGLKPFGYSGAQRLSTTLEYVFAWDATSGIIEDWMYDSMAENFLFDEDTMQWIQDSNPFAAQQMIERLFEAQSRGLWEPSDDVLDKLKRLYTEVETVLEDMTDRDDR